ncbi:MAG: hypothetical protein IBJ09_13655 [Bacteroidia bacterium]|nr:hypothetical protein [Bacteroidia bacterium]
MRSYLSVFLFVAFFPLYAQTSFDPQRTWPVDSLRHWLYDLMDEAALKHPGFYRYTTPERFRVRLDSAAASINRPLNGLGYYRLLKPLLAQIGCLHTGIALPAEYTEKLAALPGLLPLELFIGEDRHVYVLRDLSAVPQLTPGAEILSINGRPVPDVLRILMNAIPSDGYNQTLKLRMLNHRFPQWYQSMIGADTLYVLGVMQDGEQKTVELSGLAATAMPPLPFAGEKPLQFEIQEGIGILRIRSFARTPVRAAGQRFRPFIRKTFRSLRREGIRDLLLDLRYNTGGTDAHAAFLASYFFDSTFRYWDRIEVTPAIAAEIKGAARLFYRKPVLSEGRYLWQKTPFTKEFDFYEPQKPARNAYAGRCWLLTNGLCMSSCSDLTAVLRYNGKVSVIGEESGGAYQGNNSGMMPETVVPPGLILTIPLQKYTTAVDTTLHRGRGTAPDHPLQGSLQDRLSGRDTEMEQALRIIRENR